MSCRISGKGAPSEVEVGYFLESSEVQAGVLFKGWGIGGGGGGGLTSYRSIWATCIYVLSSGGPNINVG